MTSLSLLNVIKTTRPDVTIHTVQAPEDGELVNAHVVESANSLLLVDTLQLKPHAEEFKQYVRSLEKPVSRVIVSHYHPDHWFGAASFAEYPLYALGEVIDRIDEMADFVLGYHRQVHGEKAAELIPSEKVTPNLVLEEGAFDFDGIPLVFIRVPDTEAPVNLIIELPEQKILIAQDLVYNKAYPYFGEKTAGGDYCFDAWIAVLNGFTEKGYDLILPGHGDPTDLTIIPEMIGYLEFAKEAVLSGLKQDDLTAAITKKYPDYRLPLTLVMTNYMLFGPP